MEKEERDLTGAQGDRRSGDVADGGKLECLVNIKIDANGVILSKHLAKALRVVIHHVLNLPTARLLRHRQVAPSLHVRQAVRRPKQHRRAVLRRRPRRPRRRRLYLRLRRAR